MPKEAAHDTLFSAVEWHWDGLGILCFPCMYFSVWTHAHYSNTSSPIRPHMSHRSQREHIRWLVFPTQGNHSDKMKSGEFIAASIWFFHFRKKSSIWSRAKWNLGRESAPMTRSSTACQLWSVSIIWVWSHKGVGMGTVRPSGPVAVSSHMDSSSFISCFFIWPSRRSWFIFLANVGSRKYLSSAIEEKVKKVRPSVLSILSLFPTESCSVWSAQSLLFAKEFSLVRGRWTQ